MIVQDRRQFLATAAAFTSAAMIPEKAAAAGRLSHDWHPLSDQERRRLVGLAQFGPKQPAAGRNGVAVTTHPLATQAAIDMLHAGGTAADAICAASLVQTVVEPHLTTITGVFSLLYHDAATGRTTHLNCSNNAPLALKNFDLSKLAEAEHDGRSATTPGYWAGVEAAVKKWGRLPLKQVMAPAIHYARQGFEVHPFLWWFIADRMEDIASHPQGREVYMPTGSVVRPGDRLYQRRYADLLDRLSEEGSDYFYRGGFARKFAAAVQESRGYITLEDFSAYQPIWAEPVRGRYRGYEIASSPFPDFGGNCFVEIMNVLNLTDLKTMGPAFDSPETALLMYRTMGEVFTDAMLRNHGRSRQTIEEALSPETAERRFAKVRKAGPIKIFTDALKEANPLPGSTHPVVIDRYGNVATVLHSVMSDAWSTRLFVDGTYICAAGAHYGSGMPPPGQRLRARVLPNIFFKDGAPVLVSGSPSVSLVENIVQNSTNILDFAIPIAESVSKPRFGGLSIFKPNHFMAERTLGQAYIDALSRGGLPVDVVSQWNIDLGSFEGIAIDGARVGHACGDPRRTALALAA